MTDDILSIQDLSIEYRTPHGPVRAVRDLSMRVPAGEIVGIVGESGSGKSSLLSAMIGLLPPNAHVTSGEVVFEGSDILAMGEAQLRAVRGAKLSVVFQDPMTSLNPVFPIGTQMLNVQYRERGLSNAAKRDRSAEMLKAVGIADPVQRLSQYPHEFSGGMRQRIAIAMALLCKPRLLIADEPTTALDVTMEAQILHLLRELRTMIKGSILFISHNLGAVAELCDRVIVMYAGEIVESGPVDALFHGPRHPYTQALLRCDPARLVEASRDLPTIPGEVPDLTRSMAGCVFAARCPSAFEPCAGTRPPVRHPAPQHSTTCHL